MRRVPNLRLRPQASNRRRLGSEKTRRPQHGCNDPSDSGRTVAQEGGVAAPGGLRCRPRPRRCPGPRGGHGLGSRRQVGDGLSVPVVHHPAHLCRVPRRPDRQVDDELQRPVGGRHHRIGTHQRDPPAQREGAGQLLVVHRPAGEGPGVEGGGLVNPPPTVPARAEKVESSAGSMVSSGSSGHVHCLDRETRS